MGCSRILIIDHNKLIADTFIIILSQRFSINKKDIRLLPDQRICSKEAVSVFLRKDAHKYNIILNANCLFSSDNKGVSYDGIHLLQSVYENILNRDSSRKPMIISFQSLKHLNAVDPLCEILLRNDQLYYFHKLPFKINLFSELLKQEGGI